MSIYMHNTNNNYEPCETHTIMITTRMYNIHALQVNQDNPMLLRMARIMRLMRLIRVVRHSNVFDPLILMLKSIKASICIFVCMFRYKHVTSKHNHTDNTTANNYDTDNNTTTTTNNNNNNNNDNYNNTNTHDNTHNNDNNSTTQGEHIRAVVVPGRARRAHGPVVRHGQRGTH